MSDYASNTVTIEPGGLLPYDPAAWRDALVLVVSGEVVLECVGGDSRRFARGAMIWLADLPLHGIRNDGRVPARLVAISRQSGEFLPA